MKYFEFFDRVKAWVKEHNTTIEALLKDATDGKVTKGVYQGWRTRETLPSGEYCYDLAKKMGVSCNWLISGKDFEKEIPEKNGFVPSNGDFVPAGGNFIPAHQNFIPSNMASIVSDLRILDDGDLQQVGIYVRALADKAKRNSQASGVQRAV